MMWVCQQQRRHLWESLRESLSVPPFTRTFLKSPSLRSFSGIAELLVLVVIVIWLFGRLRFSTSQVIGCKDHLCVVLLYVKSYCDWLTDLGFLCVFFYTGSCRKLYYCNIVEWFWWCFDTVGLVIWPVKIIPEMAYNVLSGTLNLYTTTAGVCFACFLLTRAILS